MKLEVLVVEKIASGGAMTIMSITFVKGRIVLDLVPCGFFLSTKSDQDLLSKFDLKESDEMLHQVRWVSGLIGLMLYFAANPIQAGMMTFNVNLSGVDTDFLPGTVLKVFGTITVDPALPISAAATTSSLQFQRQSETPILLPSSFTQSRLEITALQWSLSGGNLYIDRISSENQSIIWGENTFGTNGALAFQSGLSSAHVLISGAGGFSFANLKPPGPADGPNGFLIGTTAIPEPSSALLLIGVGAVYALTRRRRG